MLARAVGYGKMDMVSLGARGQLPRGYIVSSWWVLKQFAPTLPGESMVGTF